jgi:hypothetical protein
MANGVGRAMPQVASVDRVAGPAASAGQGRRPNPRVAWHTGMTILGSSRASFGHTATPPHGACNATHHALSPCDGRRVRQCATGVPDVRPDHATRPRDPSVSVPGALRLPGLRGWRLQARSRLAWRSPDKAAGRIRGPHYAQAKGIERTSRVDGQRERIECALRLSAATVCPGCASLTRATCCAGACRAMRRDLTFDLRRWR